VIESDSESSDEEGIFFLSKGFTARLILFLWTERMDEDIEIEEPAPPTAVVEEKKPAEPQQENICRERKLVDKVFKDEKGFIGRLSDIY